MSFLDYIKPINKKALTAQVQESFDRSTWMLSVLNFIMALLKNQFMGKVINVKLDAAIKAHNEEYKISYLNTEMKTSWSTKQSTHYSIKVYSSINRDWTLYLDVRVTPDRRLDWDATANEASRVSTQANDSLRQGRKLLDNPKIIHDMIEDWEHAIGSLKLVNCDAKKYDVLQYEFDLSRYK